MTLILTLANASGVCQSSDYQLTDGNTGAPISDRAGCKQLQVSFKTLDLRLAFTGIAVVGIGSARESTIEKLSAELKALPQESDLQDICEAIKRLGIAVTSPYGSRGVLEVILTVATVGKPFRVAVISNADWSKQPPQVRSQFTIAIRTITKPFHLVSGYRDCVPAAQKHRLRVLAKQIGNSKTDVLDALSKINVIAAKKSRGYVSEDCWVTCQVADGRVRRSAGLNVGQHTGHIHTIVGGFDILEFVRKNFRAAPGQEIRLVQSAGVIAGPGDATPAPPPVGEPRRFTLSGSSVTGLLRNPAGEGSASIAITQLEGIVEMRCNEEVSVPFADIVLEGIGLLGAAFPKPLLPLPQLSSALSIGDAAVPRGWEYSLGYWIEGDTHRAVIPQSSRSIRNLAFLGPDDEIVIVAPSTTMEFAWGGAGRRPSATLQARLSWRSRLDGTRG